MKWLARLTLPPPRDWLRAALGFWAWVAFDNLTAGIMTCPPAPQSIGILAGIGLATLMAVREKDR